jgi:hypothetical protein
LLPGVANTPKQLQTLISFAKKIGAEEVFAEPVNARGAGLQNTEESLKTAGYKDAADAVRAVRTKRSWSQYVVQLIADLQHAMRRRGMIDKLRFLLYSSGLTEQDKDIIRKDDEGVIWLGTKTVSQRPIDLPRKNVAQVRANVPDSETIKQRF